MRVASWGRLINQHRDAPGEASRAGSTPRPIPMGHTPPASGHGRQPSLRSNAIWTFAANAFFSGTRWLTILVLVRWGSPDLVGQYVLGMAITQPIFMFANLDLSSAQATDARRDFTFRDYAALRSLTIPLAVATTAALLLFLDLGGHTSLVVLLVAATRVVMSVDMLFFGVFSQHERLDKAAVALALRGLLGLVAFFVLLVWTGSLPWALTGTVAGWLVAVLGYAAPQSRPLIASEGGTHDERPIWRLWSEATTRKLAWTVFPLGLAALLSALTYNIPRYVVQAVMGSDQLGVFAAVAYIVQLVQLFAKSFRHATAPRLAKYYASDKVTAFSSLMMRVLGGFAALSVVGVGASLLFGSWFLTTLYGPEYNEPRVLAIAIGASGLLTLATFMTAGVLATRRFGPVFITRAVGAAAALGSGVLLVPSIGLEGAAWSLVIAYLASGLTAAWFLRSAVRNHTVDLETLAGRPVRSTGPPSTDLAPSLPTEESKEIE